jgi:hypothetical protein
MEAALGCRARRAAYLAPYRRWRRFAKKLRPSAEQALALVGDRCDDRELGFECLEAGVDLGHER